jgi:small conductance mechanosensitive channel
MDVNTLVQNTGAILVAVGLKVVGAIALWLIGRWLIGFALGLIGRAAA